MIRTGCLYQEIQRNVGKRRQSELSGNRYVRGVGFVRSSRYRWVAEISCHNKRYRFRSTNFDNARQWLELQSQRLSD